MNETSPIVLVIEDHEDIASLAAYFLRRNHYNPVVAQDGLEGLNLARSLSPALILCDASLPKLSGSEVLAVLRANPVTASIPFVLMSGFECTRWGNPMPDAFLQKPFQIEEMLALVRTFARPGHPATPTDGGMLRPVFEVA
jgi:DNA-binding response OmpR family regulator